MGKRYESDDESDEPEDRPPYDDGYGDHVRKVCTCDICTFGRRMDAAEFALRAAGMMLAIEARRPLTEDEQKLYTKAVRAVPTVFPDPPTGTDHRAGK